jgi:hypothetical protein
MRPTFIKALAQTLLPAATLLLAVSLTPSCKEDAKAAETPATEVAATGAAPAPTAKDLGAGPNTVTVDESFDARFVGKWEIQQWGVGYEITRAGNVVTVTGADVKNTEDFEVSDVTWDGAAKTLQASFRMPSTNHKTRSVLKVLDDDRIEDKYTGSAAGEDTWTRVKK